MASKKLTTARMMTHKLSVRRLLANLIEQDETLVVFPKNQDIGTIALFIQARWN